jgi:putative sigma-54 modulation protein
MKTNITFRKISSSEALKNHVLECIQKLDRYKHNATEAHVILAMERYLQVAEIVLTGKQFRALGKAATQDMYASIEEAISKVEKTLKRHHDKKIKEKSHSVKELPDLNP